MIPAIFSGVLGQSARRSLPYTAGEKYMIDDARLRYLNAFHPTDPMVPPYASRQAWLDAARLGRGGATGRGLAGMPQAGTAVPGSGIPGGGRGLASVGGAYLGYKLNGLPGIMEGALTGYYPGHWLLRSLHNSRIGQLAERTVQHPTTQDLLRVLSQKASNESAPYANFFPEEGQ
jgi:hypothetical protein